VGGGRAIQGVGIGFSRCVRVAQVFGLFETTSKKGKMDMKKIAYAVILGAILGAVDGLSAAYEFGFGHKVLTIAGLSSIKSLVVGLIVGITACYVRNKGVIIVIGTILALAFAYLAAAQPDPDTGEKYYAHIMGTGGLVGLIVGYATAKFSEKQTASS
jgi:hypothetical protein